MPVAGGEDAHSLQNHKNQMMREMAKVHPNLEVMTDIMVRTCVDRQQELEKRGKPAYDMDEFSFVKVPFLV